MNQLNAKMHPEIGRVNKPLAAALGVTKFITIIALFLVSLCCVT